MSLLMEYINRKMGVPDLEAELVSLIGQYNKLQNTYLFVYTAAIEKPIPQISLDQSDYYTIVDLLRDQQGNSLDYYIQTPGGSGEAAEEIVRFLRSKYSTVRFLVAGEAKSAGTIIVMSGDEILMTDTASLGPIDAQVRIGRSVVSAHDYMEWINDKRKEAAKQRSLNPFDAVMVAQISPGELLHIDNALRFAQDLVKEWLPKYKFKNWTQTETRKKTVTDRMRNDRARQIAKDLTNHTRWRSHGRSLKIEDLNDIGLQIQSVDQNPKLKDVVNRIHVVCRLLFESSTIYKIFATADQKIFRLAQRGPAGIAPQMPNLKEIEGIHLDVTCEKCGKIHKLFAQFKENAEAADEFKKAGMKNFPASGTMKCDCGFQIDLTAIKNNLEAQSGRRIITEK